MRRPKLRQSVQVFLDDSQTLHFLQTSSGVLKSFEVEQAIVQLIPLLDGRTVQELHDAVQGLPGSDELDAALMVMEEEGLLQESEAAVPAWLSSIEEQRYHRQLLFFADFASKAGQEYEQQLALRRSTVTLIGVGGTGSWIAYALAAAGIGHLTLCDPDRVEPSNLNRQLLYTPSDAGRLKVEVLQRKLTEFNPYVEVTARVESIVENTDFSHLLQGASLVVNCADKPDINITSDWVSAACMARRIPHIVGGGYSGHLAVIGPTILPGQSACWRCVRRATARDQVGVGMTVIKGRDEGPAGSIGPIAAIIANIQAFEAIRVLTGCSPAQMAGRISEFDVMSLEMRHRDIPRDPGCEWCGIQAEVTA
jgi:bacteriocin biosynthesis cyclodehydratase domain-containing protein